MIPELAAARPRGDIYRIGRAPDAWEWPPWEYAGEDGTFGNRYDDPRGEYRVLYACSQRLGAFIETLARYRTDPALVAAYDQIVVDEADADAFPTIPPGVVPTDWRLTRAIGTARHPGPFADIGNSSSLAHLRVALAGRLLGDEIENWAIFEGSEPHDMVSHEITRDDPDLVAALSVLELVLAPQ